MKASDEWYTPQWLVDWAHEYLGGVPDFDPASSHLANFRVRATKYDYLYPEDLSVVRRRHDHWVGHICLTAPDHWPPEAKTVFLNPPFSQARQFAQRLVNWHSEPGSDRNFFAIFPANVNSSYWQALVARYSVFLPEKRVAFVDPRTSLEAKAPRGNVCVVVGGDKPKAPVPGIWI